jgi:ABC-2 type transport system permease protein
MTMNDFAFQAHATWVVAKKNAMVYYAKPPVFTFGLIFPFFFYLAFAAGHRAPPEALAPGIVAMALFFTASAVGPLVTPWERQARTYERLITSPASLMAILAGGVLAGAGFGVVLVLVPLAFVGLFTDAYIVSAAPLALGIIGGAGAFAALGVLMAAPATEGPSQVMMLSNLVRLPLIFVSGVFIPLHEMPAWGQWLAPFSPLSYAADLIRIGFGEVGYWSATIDAIALLGFTIVFVFVAKQLHQRTRDRAR